MMVNNPKTNFKTLEGYEIGVGFASVDHSETNEQAKESNTITLDAFKKKFDRL